jgi:hypothetical protein
MIKVVVAKGNIPVKRFVFNERKDDRAFEKAFVELDRATWSFEPGQVIGSFQNDTLLYSDPDTGWIHKNNNGIIRR